MKTTKLCIIIWFLLLFLAGCNQSLEDPISEELPVSPTPIANSNEPSALDSERLVFEALSKEVRLINLLEPENTGYKEWLDNFYDEVYSKWFDRPERFYLSEHICIIEKDNNLYYFNGETGEEKLLLESEDSENDGTEEIDVASILFAEKIDEHKFIYLKFRGQWDDGCGIFDTSNFSDHPIRLEEEWGWFSALFGEYVYSANPPDYLKTNVNTYETVIILPGVEKEYSHFHTAAFSPDGTLYAVREKDSICTYRIDLYDVESGKLLASFRFYAEFQTDSDFYSIFFKDNQTIYIEERNIYDHDSPNNYLVEIDISSYYSTDVGPE